MEILKTSVWRGVLYVKYAIRYRAIMSDNVTSPKHIMRFLDHTLALLCLEIHSAIDCNDGCRPKLSNTCCATRHGTSIHRNVLQVYFLGYTYVHG